MRRPGHAAPYSSANGRHPQLENVTTRLGRHPQQLRLEPAQDSWSQEWNSSSLRSSTGDGWSFAQPRPSVNGLSFVPTNQRSYIMPMPSDREFRFQDWLHG